MTPKTPLRADYRLLRTIGKTTVDSFDPTPDDLDLVGKVFVEKGGSWARLFWGAPNDMGLVKAVMKDLFKEGKLTKKPDWNVVVKKEKKIE